MAKPVNITPIRHRHNVNTHIFILSSVPAGTMWTLRTVLVDWGGGRAGRGGEKQLEMGSRLLGKAVEMLQS